MIVVAGRRKRARTTMGVAIVADLGVRQRGTSDICKGSFRVCLIETGAHRAAAACNKVGSHDLMGFMYWTHKIFVLSGLVYK